MKSTLALALLCLSLAAHADVYRCETAGKTQYTDQPAAGCRAVPVAPVNPDLEDLAAVQRAATSAAYERDMNVWREHYAREQEQTIEALRAQNQRPIVVVQPAAAPVPVYPWYAYGRPIHGLPHPKPAANPYTGTPTRGVAVDLH